MPLKKTKKKTEKDWAFHSGKLEVLIFSRFGISQVKSWE